jgi:plastocyanin
VLIKNFVFAPANAVAAVGDTVVFTNADFVPHSARQDGGGFDSRSIAGGQTWRYVVEKKGRIAYHCTMHPVMKAVLDVR